MTVESASYISQLDTTLPTAADLISEGDDHLRLTKTVLKTQFPNFGTTAITASAAEVNYLVGVTGPIQSQLSNQVAGPTHAATAKTTPVDADELPLSDSAASWELKKLTFANLKTWLTGLFVSRASDSSITTPSGQATLTIKGGTDRGNFIASSGAADDAGVVAGALGFVHEAATTGSAERRLALISAATNGATAGNRGGKLGFSLKPDGSATLVERMSIDSSGNVGIGESSPGVELHIKDIAGNSRVDVFLEGLAADGTAVPQAVIWGRKVQSGAGEARIGCVAFGLDGATANNRGGYVQFSTKSNGSNDLLARMTIDSSGNVLATGGNLGYGAGAGGTVTQATSKSTTVTLNKPSGRVTMHDASLNASTAVTFQLQSSYITTSSTVTVTVLNPSIASAAVYRLEVLSNFAGGVFLRLSNTGGSALAEALQFHFNVHAGSTS